MSTFSAFGEPNQCALVWSWSVMLLGVKCLTLAKLAYVSSVLGPKDLRVLRNVRGAFREMTVQLKAHWVWMEWDEEARREKRKPEFK